MKCKECLDRGDNYYPNEYGDHVCLCCSCIENHEQDPVCASCWYECKETCFDDGTCSKEKSDEINAKTDKADNHAASSWKDYSTNC